MRHITFIAVFFVSVALIFSGTAYAQSEELAIADFNEGVPPNNIGGDFGSWNYDPSDETQGCYDSLEPDDYRDPKTGYCLRLDYDVQSPNPAFNGFWMKLKGIDLSDYNTLSFWVKGAKNGKFTKRFKVELKNNMGKRAVYPVIGVTKKWKEVRINFKNTRAIKDWTRMSEFTVVFDDLFTTFKEGTIYIDQIEFKNTKQFERR